MSRSGVWAARRRVILGAVIAADQTVTVEPVQATGDDAATSRPRALAAMEPGLVERLFDDESRTRLSQLVALVPGAIADFADADASELAAVEILITCWGAPTITAEVLERAPRLRAVVHAAGTVKQLVSPSCWERPLLVSSQATTNGRPVAEFTVACILLANKRVFELSRRYGTERSAWTKAMIPSDIGNYRRVIGIVGASGIGRMVIELLRPYELDVVLYDPYVDADEAAALGVVGVELDELCSRSDVVSLHAPLLPATHRMIDARRLALLADGTTLINTARGALVDTESLTEELVSGRLHAVLDHTDPEVLPDDSPLYELPNVFVTPHVAGSLGVELHRLGAAAVDEVERLVTGLPLEHPVTQAQLDRLA